MSGAIVMIILMGIFRRRIRRMLDGDIMNILSKIHQKSNISDDEFNLLCSRVYSRLMSICAVILVIVVAVKIM